MSRYLTELADVCRAAGLKVSEVPGWKTRGHGAMVDVRTITCHHTAGPTLKRSKANYPSLAVVRDGRPGLDGPLAQLGLGRDGTVYIIAAGVCWHAGVSLDDDYTNYHAIGIEAENAGTAEDPWTEAQLEAYALLCAALVVHYGLKVSDVLGHKETCKPRGRKSDPSFDMDAHRVRVNHYIQLLTTKPAAKPTPTKEEDTVRLVKVTQLENGKPVTRVWALSGLTRSYVPNTPVLQELIKLYGLDPKAEIPVISPALLAVYHRVG